MDVLQVSMAGVVCRWGQGMCCELGVEVGRWILEGAPFSWAEASVPQTVEPKGISAGLEKRPLPERQPLKNTRLYRPHPECYCIGCLEK
jgi:hypothetical protein